MPICLMARTFMTRHFLNGLWGFFSFHLYSSRLYGGMMTMTTEKQNKEDGGRKNKLKILHWLGCFLMTLLTVFPCTLRTTLTALTFAMLVSHMIEVFIFFYF